MTPREMILEVILIICQIALCVSQILQIFWMIRQEKNLRYNTKVTKHISDEIDSGLFKTKDKIE